MRVLRHAFVPLAIAAALIAPAAADAQATPPVEKKAVGRASATLTPGIVIGNTMYLSGQLPPGNTRDSSITVQTEGTINTIKGLLEQGGFTLADVVQVTVYLADIADFQAMNAGYTKMFATDPKPTRTTVQAALVGGAKIEITVVAVKTK
jgi:2-iminobutanoate/2-iminopropanoate deaminase